ncbi:hypothetical protein DT019_38430 [Streptomyces sp. SDr-06]|uniref:hypothetical protein n=1 Tax=Streptomyces sp. SDr-06 TaxID=2267702 RepID=UPI000DEAF1A5|nr:hypothetical protein [Streptomyces sp. SDr-06]RCH59641.1 hypothetical protein DT019_38430 [Streptomyces sp. SDr-06]
MKDAYLKATVVVSLQRSKIRAHVAKVCEEMSERGERGDNPVVTALLWVAGIAIAVSIVAALVALGTKASTKVDGVDLGK